ncbi:glycerol-3-phosphate acyltransferase 4-like isoform X2 [Embiotoca jacksoni]|uniref:glycerol-3-phosphate acyltransferase 4-like isoform X2 n=1 Tax=Embiotoca jacksoni TaxID=100190 RepID=UPI00370411A4
MQAHRLKVSSSKNTVFIVQKTNKKLQTKRWHRACPLYVQSGGQLDRQLQGDTGNRAAGRPAEGTASTIFQAGRATPPTGDFDGDIRRRHRGRRNGNRENKPKNGGICVANHTTPIDVIILANDGCYSMVGQVQGGLMGMVQRPMVKSSPHIWFERLEVKDRHLVAKRLGDHVADKTKQPILIFPEGTSINNTSVMMFKKGSFKISCTVYPVAIKYDPRFGDAFWNSSKFSMVSYLLRMMSSWAIVCSVWYLPPMNREGRMRCSLPTE